MLSRNFERVGFLVFPEGSKMGDIGGEMGEMASDCVKSRWGEEITFCAGLLLLAVGLLRLCSGAKRTSSERGIGNVSVPVSVSRG